MSTFATLQDDFNDGSVKAQWTTDVSSGSVTQSGGKLACAPAVSTADSYGQIYSTSTYDLTSSYILIQILQTASQNCTTTFNLSIDPSNRIFLEYTPSNGNLNAAKRVGGVTSTLASISFSLTTMQWWRIRESGGITYWEYSPSAIEGSWTTLFSVSNPITVTTLTASLLAYDGSSDATPGAAWFDNFNMLPVHGSNNMYRNIKVGDGMSRNEGAT